MASGRFSSVTGTYVRSGGFLRGRGESYFVRLPRLGAWLYDKFLSVEPIQGRLREIAHELVPMADRGRFLDVGMGPGRLLLDLHRLNPNIELFGLDLSASMVKQARKNLHSIRADLRQGTIRHTGYESDFFTIVTCVGSFYLWDYPEESLEEIFRILKRGQSAYLFEVYRDVNQDEFHQALQQILRQLDPVRRLVGPPALRKAVITAYRTEEFAKIISRTSFADSYAMEKIKLAGMPMWLRVTLTKRT
jgi:ubiquinone/menaquinone biosynthesis C-methylase UbiE